MKNLKRGENMSTQCKKVLAIDGNSILNRAFYGVKPLTTSDGRPTNAIFGFFNIIMKTVDSLCPDSIAVAFDLKAPTFRHKECDFYKANRHGMPDELAAQLSPTKDIIRALGFNVMEIEGYEADDILGTCAALADADGECNECYVLTGDRDSFQLVSEKCKVLLAGNVDTVTYDTAKIAEVYGLEPKKLIDVKALMGDTSDNIPGVPGIGEKTALKLISEFGSLDGVYESYADSPSVAKGVKAKLEAGKESAYKSRFLAEIFTAVPLPLCPEDIEVKERDEAELLRILSDLELKSLIKRFGLSGMAPAKTTTAIAKNAQSSMFGDEADCGCTNNVPENITEKEGVSPATDGVFCVFPDVRSNKVYTCTPGDKTVYSCNATPEICRGIFKNTNLKTVLYNSKDAVLWLLNEMDFNISDADSLNISDDLMLLAYVCDPADKNDAMSLAEKYSDCMDVSSSAELCLSMGEILERLTKKLASGVDGADNLYRNIELPLAVVLSKMEYHGMKLDTAGLSEYGRKIDARLEERKNNIYELSGMEFNINSPKQLGEVLFEHLGLHGFKKTKSGFSTDAETLEKLRSYHPIVNEILDFRLVSKLRSTYVEGLLSAVDQNGRLHTNFKQAFTQTGRLSSAEPNLQNIPIRKPEGRELRRFFVPEDSDHVLIDADYSQIELRLLAAISGDQTMINAFKDDIDIHSVTASQVFGLPLELINSELRKKAKAVNFGIVYGISDYSLAGDIGSSIKEAGEYIANYFEKYAKVKEYLDGVIEKAQADGYVTTLYGRKRNIPELTSPKKPLQAFGKRVAMNTPIQGTAADIIKIAMLKADKALTESGLDARLILQVHDELIVESAKSCAKEAAQILKREMENAVTLNVPLKVELEIGETWFAGH